MITQKYLQSNTTRIDENEEKKRDTEIWMSSKSLPENLKNMIRSHEEEKWQKTRGIEEKKFLDDLPDHIRLHIERNSLNNVSSLYPC